MGGVPLGDQRLDGFECRPARREFRAASANLGILRVLCSTGLDAIVPRARQPCCKRLDQAVAAVIVAGAFRFRLDPAFHLPGLMRGVACRVGAGRKPPSRFGDSASSQGKNGVERFSAQLPSP